jgi:hypothetical protein
VEKVFNIPGRGPVKMHFLKLPPGALKRVQPRQKQLTQHITLGTLTFPTLWTSLVDYTDSGSADALWLFPTTGFDTNNAGPVYGVPNTIESAAASSQNTADVALGQIGNPALIDTVTIIGGMADLTKSPPVAASGSVFILLFDGVDASNAPIFGTNSATLQKTDSMGNTLDGYEASFDTTVANDSGFGEWSLDTSSNPYVLHDTQGRFGLMVAKVTDGTPTTNQWEGFINAPNGQNAVYQFTGGDLSTSQLVFLPADPTFNQGAANFGAYNYFFELDGTATNSSGTAITTLRGTLQGNIRRRGVGPITPPLQEPPSSQNVEPEEYGPGFYTIIAFDQNNNVVRQDFFFAQPSYDATGAATVNYSIPGYPAGTYTLEIRQMPIQDANNNLDVSWLKLSQYPYGDFIPVDASKTITNNTVTTLTARMERLGDIDDSNNDNQPDGVVDFNDLGRLISSYGLSAGQDGFDSGADIVGSVTTTNPNGLPDGTVDFNDLGAMILEYGLGSLEQFAWPQ